ncbi:DMT family transporter [Nocardia thraciensis]
MAESRQHPSGGAQDRRRGRRSIRAWGALYLAIVLDVAQVFALDASAGFTSPLLVPAAIAAFVAELGLFTLALRHLPPATAYGLLGLGTAAVSVISIGWLREQVTVTKTLALVAVIAGAVLLNLEEQAS